MNDFSELEKQLRELKPVQPSPDLVDRIEHVLGEERSIPSAGLLPREPRFHFNWLSLGLGLAAAAALVLFFWPFKLNQRERRPTLASITPAPAFSSASSNGQFVPAGLTQVVYHTSDEGLHFTGNSAQPMRRVRSSSHKTLLWQNPKTGASLRISYPSEEVSLVPVTGQ